MKMHSGPDRALRAGWFWRLFGADDRRGRGLSLFVLAILSPWSLLLSTPLPSATTSIDISRYRLTFDEPFDKLDASAWGPGTKWIAHTPWAGDFGDARFLDPSPKGPFTTKNGMLSITMTQRDGRWTSGLLSAADRRSRGFVQAGGYFEMRAKLPGGAGVWPAFWLGSNAPDGVAKPEIDILEYYGHDATAYMATVHVWRDGRSEFGDAIRISVPSGSLERDFHTYGVSISPEAVIFYLDRKEVGRMPSRPEYMMPVYPMVNLAAGGGWPIKGMPDPSVMMIDYVRVYQPR
jgi:beta-glucanase (GH16 family)